jgi:glycine cleavage system H protein
VEEDTAIVGITDHAQDALGDIVYIELPDVGDVFDRDDVFGVIESVKTTSDLYSPVSGTVAEINDQLLDNSAVINDDPYGEGWMIKLKVKDHGEIDALLTWAQYEKFLAEEDQD